MKGKISLLSRNIHTSVFTHWIGVKNDDNILSWQEYRNWQAQTLLQGEEICTIF